MRIAGEIGYPVLVRPSYVLGGRAMRICYDEASLRARPVEPSSLVDRFVEDAIEVDVDAVCDGTRTWIGAVMQHVEEAGVHSGDSACVIPTLSLGEELERQIRAQTAAIAEALGVRGLINVQFAVQGSQIYVIEANPRASRTVPFVAKATGVGLVEAACRAALRAAGRSARRSPPTSQREGGGAAVQPVLGRRPDPGSGDALDRRGDGHRAGLPDGVRQGRAGRRAAAAERGDGCSCPFATPTSPPRRMLAALLQSLGFDLFATAGTARALRRIGIPVEAVPKVTEGSPNVADLIAAATSTW